MIPSFRSLFSQAFRKTVRVREAAVFDNSRFLDRLDQPKSRVDVTYLGMADSGWEEDPYETLLCLKYGARYGMISKAAYESGKADLLARI